MKKYIAILFLLPGMLFQDRVNAQCTNPQSPMNTYWHYRYRLTHYFMDMGMDSGKSIPAYIRNGGTSDSGCNEYIWWSDQGRNLGYYISTLATEYYLLKKNGQNTNETVMELFYALHAVFRLDSSAMTGWVNASKTVSNTVCPNYTSLPITWPGDGYMMQDDVPGNFYEKVDTAPFIASTRTNPYYQGYGAIGSGEVGPVTVVSSAYSGAGNNYANVHGTSQDNYYAILMGLCLCEQLLGDSIYSFYNSLGTVHFATQYTDLRSIAIAEGTRIMNYIIACDFQLTYPDGSSIGLGGGQDYAYCAPLEQIADTWFGFSNATAITCPAFNKLVWNNYDLGELSLPANPPPSANIEMGCEIAAMSNMGGAYSNGCPGVDSLLENMGYYTELELSESNTLLGVARLENPSEYDSIYSRYSNIYGEDQLFLAVYQILYPNTTNYNWLSLCIMQDIINSAPYDGPFHHEDTTQANADFSGCGWAAPNRFIWGPPYQRGGPGYSGNFNGLDYMLFFNLYTIISEMESNNSTYIPSSCIPYNYPSEPLSCLGNYTVKGYDTLPYAIWSNYCSPIYVNQLNVSDTGGLWLVGSEQSFIDLKPTSGNIIIKHGAFFDALCFGTCCQAPYYTYQSDSGAVHDRRPQRNIDTGYRMSSEFAPKPNYDALIAYPNPVTIQTAFQFAVKETTPVTISIFNIQGDKVKDVFVNQTYNQGNYVRNFNASGLAPGTYFAVMPTKDNKKVVKIIKN